MKNTSDGRLWALEGLRGAAAIIVVIFHALLIFYTIALYGQTYDPAAVQRFSFENLIYGNPLSVFTSGGFAVAIFFVLSGFVLSIGYFQTGNMDIIKKLAAKRYLRLMIPALTSILLVWAILSLGLATNLEAAKLTQSHWLASIWNFTPNFFDAFFQGTWTIFVSGEYSYNPVLWTMFYEMTGSFLIFGFLGLFGRVPRRWLLYIVLILVSFQTFYLGFVLGLILADLYNQGKAPFNIRRWWVKLSMLVLGLFLGGYPVQTVEGTVYQALSIFGSIVPDYFPFYTAIGAALVITVILTWAPLERFFSWKPISNLGKYTFSLYLTHKLVLFTITTGMFISLYGQKGIGFHEAAILSILSSVPFIILVTYLFEKYIDSPSIRLSGLFSRWLLRRADKTE